MQFEIPENSEAGKIQAKLRSRVKNSDLGVWGREETPHITFRYGLLDNDYSRLIPYLSSLAPFFVTFSATTAFPPTENSAEDVPLIVSVVSEGEDSVVPSLLRINEELKSVANYKPDEFAGFSPHMTVAYVKVGHEDRYVGNSALVGVTAYVDHAVIKPAYGTGDSVIVPFLGGYGALGKADKRPRKVTAQLNPQTPISRRTEARITRLLTTELKALADEIGDDVESQYAAELAADQIADGTSLEGFDRIAESILPELETAASAAGNEALKELRVAERGLFDLVDVDARNYAKARAAEMVGRKWVDGKLVNNPDARWAITDTTRQGIHDTVVKAYEDGMTPAQLRKELMSSYDFSKQRATLIAKTETAKASTQGTLHGWKRSGLVSAKEWLLSNDHDFDDECDGNADEGPIPLEDDFESGDDGPPAHPGCDCSLVATVDEE